MDAFIYGNLITQYVDGNMFFLLQEHDKPFYVRIVDGDKQYRIQPPNLFATDFLSIPWFGRWLIRKSGAPEGSGRAAVIHDYLYSFPGAFSTPANQLFADDVFKAILKAGKTPKWKTNLMYSAVRIGGGRVYGNKNKLNEMRFA